MGFFFEETKAKAPARKRQLPGHTGPLGAAKGRAGASAKLGCDGCPRKAGWPALLTPRMGPALKVANTRPDVLLLGSAPNMEDDRAGFPGGHKTIDPAFDAIGRSFHDRILYQNAVRCASPTGHEPKLADVRACAGYVVEDARPYPIKAIIALGQEALDQFAPGFQIRDIRGIPFPVKFGESAVWLMATMAPEFVMQYKGKYDDGPMAPVFTNDLRRFIRQLDAMPAPMIDVIDPADTLIATTEEEARAFLDAMNPGELGLDLETTGFKPYVHGAKILTAAFSDGELMMAFPVDHPEAVPEWALPLLLETVAKRPWIAHNAAFELLWLTYFARHSAPWVGSDKFAAFEDTMAMVRLHHERETVNDLDTASLLHLGVDIKRYSPFSQADMGRLSEFPLSQILPYNAVDAWASARVSQRLLHKVRGENYDRIVASIYSTTEMEMAGLLPDYDASERLHAKWRGAAKTALAAVPKLYEVKRFEAEKQIEFNIGSADHIGIALVEYGNCSLPRTAKGAQYKTDDDVLSKLDNPLAAAALAYREANKMASTYIEPILAARTAYPDMRLHPAYTTMLTATLRLSSNGPNIQNFPARKHPELRQQIIADPGHFLLAADYAQIEARILAMASRDRRLCDSIIAGRDIHTDWLNNVLRMCPSYMDRLAQMSGKDDDKGIRKFGRTIIKTDLVFAAFYGSVWVFELRTEGGCRSSV